MSDFRDDDAQGAIHDALANVLPLDEGEILVGWCVTYETVRDADERPQAGQVYGPGGMTTWRVLGLLEWARRFLLCPDDESE